MPHRRDIERTAELQLARLGRQVGAHEDQIGDALIAFALKVVLGQPQSVVAKRIHFARHVFGHRHRFDEPLVRIAALVSWSSVASDFLQCDVTDIQDGELLDHGLAAASVAADSSDNRTPARSSCKRMNTSGESGPHPRRRDSCLLRSTISPISIGTPISWASSIARWVSLADRNVEKPGFSKLRLNNCLGNVSTIARQVPVLIPITVASVCRSTPAFTPSDRISPAAAICACEHRLLHSLTIAPLPLGPQ